MRKHPFRLGVISLGAAFVLAAGTVAGVAFGSTRGGNPVQQAAAKAAKASSVQFNFSLAISGAGKSVPGGKISLGGSGAFDNRHQTGKLTLDLGALAASLGGATGGGAVPKTIDIVVVKGVVYIHLAALAKQLGPGKEWLKIDPRTLPKSTTGGVNLGQASKVNPQQVLASLSAAVSVKKIGSETIGGTPVTHYRASIDINRIVATLPKAQQAPAQKSLAKIGLKTIPVDFYIGPSGYPRRVAITLAHLKTTPGAAPVSINLTIDLHDYGAKVSVTAPPAAKTVDAAKLLAQLTKGLGGK